MTVTLALVGAAISVGAVHTYAPDHWMPFAALARAGHWSPRRTAAITAVCGLGHVTVSVLLGVLALLKARLLSAPEVISLARTCVKVGVALAACAGDAIRGKPRKPKVTGSSTWS